MRTLLTALALGGALVAGQASAATLASASFSLRLFDPSGPLDMSSLFPGAGATGTATSNLAASLGGGTAFAGASSYPMPDTTWAYTYNPYTPFTEIEVHVTQNAGGTFAGTAPANVGGAHPFSGSIVFKGFGGSTLLSVPLAVGSPNTKHAISGGMSVTAIAAPWTAGTATLATPPSATFSLTASAMGSNGLTPGGAGTLVLVTPLLIRTSPAYLPPTIFGFGTLTLTYVPEPGTLLLLGMGVAALAVLQQRRAAS